MNWEHDGWGWTTRTRLVANGRVVWELQWNGNVVVANRRALNALLREHGVDGVEWLPGYLEAVEHGWDRYVSDDSAPR